MPRHDDSVSLRHMLDHALEALELSCKKSRQDIESDRVLTLALLHLLLIVGESAGRISEDFRSRHPEVPWSEIIAFRNRLVHGYDVINFAIVTKILSSDLPKLVIDLERIQRAHLQGPAEGGTTP